MFNKSSTNFQPHPNFINVWLGDLFLFISSNLFQQIGNDSNYYTIYIADLNYLVFLSIINGYSKNIII